MSIGIAHPGLVARYVSMSNQPLSPTEPVTRSSGVAREDGFRRQGGERGKSASPIRGDRVSFSAEAEQIRKLQIRDREVRGHERAHAAVGGAHAGSPTLTLKKGPDGQSYAVEGEVSIDLSPVAGDPEATLEKAEITHRAALAPAEPSAADRAIAAKAMKMAARARQEIARESSDALNEIAADALTRSPSARSKAQTGTRLNVHA